jgi:hypothetical protein
MCRMWFGSRGRGVEFSTTEAMLRYTTSNAKFQRWDAAHPTCPLLRQLTGFIDD